MTDTAAAAAEADGAAISSGALGFTPLEHRLHRARTNALGQLEITRMLLDLACVYITEPKPEDEQFIATMVSARDRFRVAMERTRDLERERGDAQATREAAEEFERGKGRR